MAVTVGIDLGTSNTKLVRLADGGASTLLSEPTPTEWSALFGLVVAGLRRAAEAGPVAAIGIASMAESGYPLDADSVPLTNLLSWRDARDDAEVRALSERLGADQLFAATGVRPGPKPSLAVWLWLRANRPDTFAALRYWGGVADLVHHALTDELRTDHTLAGRTLGYRLPAAGDPLPSTFDSALVAEAGLQPEQLPRVGRPEDAPARLSRRAASATGLRAGTPVVLAGHDHQVAAWASGVRDVGQVADSVGTAEAILNLVGRAPDRPAVRRAGMSVVRTVDGRTEALLAGTATAGGFLQWLADQHSQGDVGALLAGIDSAELHPNKLAPHSWLLPYPAGRQCPEPDAEARVRVCGAPQQLGLAAIEAVSYQAQWVLEVQGQLAGRPPAALSLSGGPLHRTPLWPRIRATLSGVPTTLTMAPQVVATGAALLAGVRSGVSDGTPLPSREVASLAGIESRYRTRLGAFIASARRR